MGINFHKSVDIFSLGHMIAGLIVSYVFSIFFKFKFSYNMGIYLSPFSIFIFIGWEILEHTVINKYIYKKYLKDWSETKENSLMDIIIAEISFYISFIIFYVMIYDLFLLILNLILTLSSIPLVVYIVVKLSYNVFV